MLTLPLHFLEKKTKVPNNGSNSPRNSCQKAGQACDYSIRLNWDGRRTKRASYDGSSDNPASPTRGQRSFTIVNQIFKPDGHSRVPAQAPPEQSIKEESWNDGQATIDWENEVTGSPTWTPKYQTARPFSAGHAGAAVQMDNSGIPPEQVLDGVFPNGRPVQMRPRAFSSNHQFMSLGGHLLQDLPSPEDPGQAANVFSLPNEGDGIVGGMDDPTGMGSPPRRNTMATPTSFNGATSSLSMRFHQQHHSAMLTGPLTPATSSSYSDEETRLPAPIQAGHSTLSSPGNRRLSVKSLLSGPSDSIYSPYERAFAASANPPISPRHAYPLHNPTDEIHFYGYDLGQVDEDTGKNDDQSAISHLPPAPLTPQEQTQEFLQGSGWGSDDVLPFDFRFGNRSQGHSAGRGGYYKEPVAIEIPRSLGTLPTKLVPCCYT
ncbi:hypothetical protein IMZ48_45625 [Candidatus Bathyarchaeota archaeon]|nr:hypothetical protein [Candidatus Bathyarchaeota archaeon]